MLQRGISPLFFFNTLESTQNMKRILAIAAIALAALVPTAQAQLLVGKPTVSLGYDYANANGETKLKNTQEATLRVAQDTKIGTFDVAGIMRNVNGQNLGSDSSQGFEVGYGLKGDLHGLGLKSRIAYGQVNGIQKKGIAALTGQTANGDYASFEVEASRPVTANITGFVGYRFRHGLQADVPNQSRSYFGADVGLTDKIGLRVGFTHDRQNDRISNGVTTAVSYKF